MNESKDKPDGRRLLPFADLPLYGPRRFVPKDANLGDWTSISPLFDALEERARQVQTAADLSEWLVDWGELQAALDEEGSRRYIAMTCHTDSPEAEKEYLRFVEEIEPAAKPRQFKLSEMYLGHPMRKSLSPERYAVFDRTTSVQVELYRAENVPLETEEAKIGQQFQKLSGSLTVQFRGAERTLAQMGRYLEETDRPTREEAWRLVAARRLQEKEKFEGMFDELAGLRTRIAANAGFQNYRDYAFRSRGRFDYTVADCEDFHRTIAEEVVPVLKEQHLRRKRELQLEVLRPWDLAVDPLNRPALRPFSGVEGLLEKSGEIFNRLDPELAAYFRTMRELNLLDVANRKGKAPGGYQSTLSEVRLPFIFMNAVGVHRDVETMLHEAGHAFHSLAARDERLYAYRGAPIEFCEVASMGMEFLGNDFLEAFYSPEDARRARREHLESVIAFFPWMAIVDAFQHWIYTHPGHSRDERSAAWLELMARYEGLVDWTGLAAERASWWHKQLHIFLYPFYYVEYGIAQLGALQVWVQAKQSRTAALRNYHEALRLGGSRPLPELFARAGCRFDFSRETLAPLLDRVREELQSAP